ncbi:hypothetical protein DEJ50_01240 [Streptomyces venezuelae]|uniref:Uncharacterized protein n=1 Tax=Streptomyces venezuelae TaxID=54571 RepID=A0A5P2CY31_STRVZ|nr:hypothetical protein [Streptomyces venezuelae]QES46678.1 hypothetical protein DEJ50_01240 [Streptomyces venezuelae]
MERAEVLKRVIGILTEAQDIRRAAEAGRNGTNGTAGPDGGEDDLLSGAAAGVTTQLLNEMLPSISVPADASPQQVASLVAQALGPALHTMVSGFSLAFTSLAMVHDAGRTDVSSIEVLQELALEIEAGAYDQRDGGERGNHGDQGA